MNRYGEFRKDSWEYHIFRPDTPKPWFQYLFNDRFCSLVSQTGGGFNYALDPKVNRILRYDNIDTDLSGRYLFIKEGNEVYSANWQPMKSPYENWLTVYRPGSVRIQSENRKIRTEMRFFVPLDQTMEVWSVKVRNLSEQKRRIILYPFIDVIGGDADMEARYRNIMKLYNAAYYDEKTGSLILYKMPSTAREFENYVYFMPSVKPDSYETEKLKFFGQYRTVENPAGLYTERLGNSGTRGEDMVGVFQFNLELEAGQEFSLDLVIGFAHEKKKIGEIFQKYMAGKSVEKEYDRTLSYWENTLKKLWIKTGDEELDRMTNIWGKYQLLCVTRWRGTSAYHGTEGGLGYRDLAQDVEGIAGLEQDLAKKKLLELLQYQYKNGHAVSGFSSLEGAWDAQEASKMVSGKSDVAVWLPNAIAKYVKETGDKSFLRKKVPFLDGGSATVYEHAQRAVEYISRAIGRHGLPLIRIADWNDAYDRVGRRNRGESVWLGEALCWAALIVKELAQFLNDIKVAKRMDLLYRKMKARVNKSGWNKTHYLAAYNDKGRKIGDRHVPLNSQTWAILGRVAEGKRLTSVLRAIDSLDTPYGNVLFKPPYHEYDREIGRVTSFAEGTKENAACFSHAIAFKVVSDCMALRSGMAYRSIKKLMPTSEAKRDPDMYQVEPYVWAEYVIGPENKYYGRGSFTWNTGTAVWTYVGITEWILGIRPAFQGLVIDPQLPEEISEVLMERTFRGSVYHITITRGQTPSIELDGKKIEGNIIPDQADRKEHKVTVRIR